MRQVFVYRHHGFPVESQPGFPDGFPMRMLLYNWFGRARKWSPRQVDELELDELEWLPLLEEACLQASEVISKEEQSQRGLRLRLENFFISMVNMQKIEFMRLCLRVKEVVPGGQDSLA